MVDRKPTPPDDCPGPLLAPELRGAPMPLVAPGVWSDWRLRLTVIVVTALVMLPFLGSFGLWDPWEVHYGEVGRQMVERGDWLSPWWGSHWTAPGETPEGEYFFSKPVLLLWLMGIGMKVFGHTAFAVRIGTALIALLGVYLAYLAGSRVWSRRVGVLMAITLGTSPFYFMLSRQAQTDMPFVGLMTVALCFFLMGAFGRDRHEQADRLSWWLLGGFVGVVTALQLHTLAVGQWPWRTDLPLVFRVVGWAPVQVAFYLGLLAAVVVSLVRADDHTRGRVHLLWFYVFIALATMAKGLLGFGLPGAIILLYLVISSDWGLLRRAEIPRGVGLALVVGLPWYGAMLARHGGIGGAFWTRFIVHDHFKRLAAGVHQTDTGSFEHFIRWLGYGLFPWGSFVPAILATALGRRQAGGAAGDGSADRERDDRERARMFLFVWFFVAFTLFTASSTKFHHYIFPAVPALAMLAALLLDDIWEGRLRGMLWPPLFAASVALLLVVGIDLMADPQNLKNMFTYRYDRDWPSAAWDPGFQVALRVIVAGALLGLLLLASDRARRAQRAGIVTLAIVGVSFALWTLNGYMPVVAQSWSQQGLWQAYYERCTPVEGPPHAHPMKVFCEEPVISYKLNWRGETFFTQNELVPIRNDNEWRYFTEVNEGRCFYALMDANRLNGFRNALPQPQRPSVREVPTGRGLDFLQEIDPRLHLRFLAVTGRSNNKFILVSTNCDDSGPEAEERSGGDERRGVLD